MQEFVLVQDDPWFGAPNEALLDQIALYTAGGVALADFDIHVEIRNR